MRHDHFVFWPGHRLATDPVTAPAGARSSSSGALRGPAGPAGLRRAAAWAMVLAGALGILGCGGGGGGGSGGPTNPGPDPDDETGTFDPANDFFLKSAAFARPIFDVNDEVIDVVNPASLFEADPITGVPLPGFPKVLEPGTSLISLAELNFQQILDPLTPQIPLVPRNAALVLEFSKDIDPATLNLSDLDPDAPGQLTSASTVQVQRKDGTLIQTRASVEGQRLIIHAIVGDQIGFEPSPLVFNTFGNPVEDPVGHLRVLTEVGSGQLKSTDGLALVPRPDKLGSPLKPLPFNPGNSLLDAIVQQTETGVVTFNGFLPDLTAPRVIRPVELTDTIDSIAFTTILGQQVIEITGAVLPTPANVLANGGLGEWANARMDVTGLGGLVTSYVVLRNYNAAAPPNKPVFQLVPETVLDSSVVVGSSFLVTRSEFFEPIPPPLPSDPAQLAKITVDPENHPRDPLDPQDLLNHDLRYFLRMFDENDAEALTQWNPTTGLFLPIPPKSSVQVTFSETMDVASFRPYENFFVTELGELKTDTAFLNQRVGEARASSDGRSIRFTPFLTNQLDPSQGEFIGFGGTASSLKLVLRTLPEQADVAAIKANASTAQLAQLLDLDLKGVTGITDLGGRGLGLPAALLDQSNSTHFLLQSTSVGQGPFPPAIDFQVAFQTAPSADPDHGVIVHRFMGQPTSSVFSYPDGTIHDTVTSGVEYTDYPPEDTDSDGDIDKRFIYGPVIFDIGLTLPGNLTGATAQTIEHLIDNFNKPKNSAYSSPNGEDILAKLGFGATVPLNSPYGARFQHIYRAGDASPAFNDFNGVILDLVGLAWSPLNNSVNNTVISDLEILVGLSSAGKGQGPNTTQDNGIPNGPGTGLIQQFDCNLLEWAKACCLFEGFPNALEPFVDGEPPRTTVVLPGTPYPIQTGNLFQPANSQGKPPGTFNFYLNYPTFNAGIDPIFGKPNVFSFPYDSRFPMLIEYQMRPAPGVFPATGNINRVSPGIHSSALPRFRIWSQGQDPLANCVPNFTLGGQATGGINCGFKAGEGGPLLEPGTFTQPVLPPVPGNDMPVILPTTYQLPPKVDCVANQLPTPDATEGSIPQMGPPVLPTCNSDPNTNWYYANGMLAYPLPDTGSFPGPAGTPPTTWVGYGQGGNNPNNPINEPNYQCGPGDYGENARYFMLWKYRKRVSIIESPTIQVNAPDGLIEYQLPIIDPPLAVVDPAAGLIVEIRAGTELDFSVSVLESGYVDVTDPDFVDKVSGFNFDRIYVKFRANFAVANGQLQPPFIDTIVIPYRKVDP
jgi:hypothetical protein